MPDFPTPDETNVGVLLNDALKKYVIMLSADDELVRDAIPCFSMEIEMQVQAGPKHNRTVGTVMRSIDIQ